VLILSADSLCKDRRPGVRQQLADLQKESGLTLAEAFWGINAIDFAHRSFSGTKLPPPAGDAQEAIVSPDGTEIAFAFHRVGSGLGIARSDGTVIADYRDITDMEDFCWARDKSKLVLRAQLVHSRASRTRSILFILDLISGTTRDIDLEGAVTSQCWSPDSREIVYTSSSGIRIYNLLQNNSRELTQGTDATWSPDGNWIAFPGGDGYHVINPTGGQRKLLFKKKDPYGPILWSPDSRIVAYETPTRNWTLFDPTHLVRIRVRRLADNSDDWVAVVANFQRFVWVQPEHAKR